MIEMNSTQTYGVVCLFVFFFFFFHIKKKKKKKEYTQHNSQSSTHFSLPIAILFIRHRFVAMTHFQKNQKTHYATLFIFNPI